MSEIIGAPTSHLVDQLVADCAPVRPVANSGRGSAIWFFASSALALLGVAGIHFRPDLVERLRTPGFAALFLGGSILAAGSAWLALQSAVPGRRREVRLPRALAGLGVFLMMVVAARMRDGTPFDHQGWRCAVCVVALAVIPALGLGIWLRTRLAVTRPATTARYLGFAAGSVAAVWLAWHCPVDAGAHLLVWHIAPVFAITAILATVGGRALQL